MPRWTATVYETITQRKRFFVEADNQEEAFEKLSIGDTVREVTLGSEEVGSRVIQDVSDIVLEPQHRR